MFNHVWNIYCKCNKCYLILQLVNYYDALNEFAANNLQTKWPEYSTKIISIARKDKKKTVKDLLMKYDASKEGLGWILSLVKNNIYVNLHNLLQ